MRDLELFQLDRGSRKLIIDHLKRRGIDNNIDQGNTDVFVKTQDGKNPNKNILEKYQNPNFFQINALNSSLDLSFLNYTQTMSPYLVEVKNTIWRLNREQKIFNLNRFNFDRNIFKMTINKLSTSFSQLLNQCTHADMILPLQKYQSWSLYR